MPPDADPLEFEPHRGYLRAVARLQLALRPWLAARLDASDAVQQALLAAQAHRDQFRGQTAAELAGWLKAILHSTLANLIRLHTQGVRDVGAERPLEADLTASSRRLDAWLEAGHTSPSARAARNERLAALAAALDALPPDQRDAVLRKHLRGQPLADIAAETGRTAAAVAGLLRRGLARLRELLGDPT